MCTVCVSLTSEPDLVRSYVTGMYSIPDVLLLLVAVEERQKISLYSKTTPKTFPPAQKGRSQGKVGEITRRSDDKAMEGMLSQVPRWCNC